MTDDELYAHETRKVINIITHPDYNSINYQNDIAILEVDAAFKLAPHIDTICLPPPNSDFNGKVCAATGWGKDRFGKRKRNTFTFLSKHQFLRKSRKFSNNLERNLDDSFRFWHM